MDRNRDIAKIKRVIRKGLKEFAPEVHIERRKTTGHLEIFVISDAFEKMRDWDRHELVFDVLEANLKGDPVYRTIVSVFPLTRAEYAEDYGLVSAPKNES